MSSNECSLSEDHQRLLLQLARDSIRHGLDHGWPLPVDIEELPPELAAKRATFVTLHKHGKLRGCIGILEALRPLAEDIAVNAHNAAFHDPRFVPVTRDELDELDIHLSLLTPPESIRFMSENDLLAQLRPGVDGLILRDSRKHGTFLPSVWEQLPDAKQFLQHLKLKAGLPADYWSDSLEVYRYRTEAIG